MSPAAETLVIILSILLAIFLALGITLTIYLIILTRQIRKVTNAAERTVSDFESMVAGLSKAFSPMVVAGMVSKIFKRFKRGKGED